MDATRRPAIIRILRSGILAFMHLACGHTKANVMDFNVNDHTTQSIDPYIEKLISITSSRSVRSGSVRRDDREDLEQDLRLAVITSAAGYKANKASWHTYANGVVQCALKMRLRGHHAACRHPSRCRSLTTSCTSVDHYTATAVVDGHTHEQQRHQESAEAIRSVIARLPADQRDLAILLMGTSLSRAQRRLGWSRSRLCQVRKQIRAAFERAECDAG